MSDIAIKVEGLGKRYLKGMDQRGSLIEWVRRGKRNEWFWALEDVSFEVRQGEMLGMVGANGAGKSTLLKILSRITRPNRGRATIQGGVGSLLEVGTGFHPELTGRENVFLNGALIGLRRHEIARRFDQIVDFSGVESFIDTPLKRYSSGMKVRLGFAVAIHLEQEVLLVDEVLAVGDASFREKSMDKMDEVTHQGRTVIFVGHNLSVIAATCGRAIWLDQGRVKAEGGAPEIVDSYLKEAFTGRARHEGFLSLEGASEQVSDRRLKLTHVRLLDAEGRQVPELVTGRPVRIAVGYRSGVGAGLSDVRMAFSFHTRRQEAVAVCSSHVSGEPFDNLPERGEFVCSFPKLPLMPGFYRIGLDCSIGIHSVNTVHNAGEVRVDSGPFYTTGRLPPSGAGESLYDYQWDVETS